MYKRKFILIALLLSSPLVLFATYGNSIEYADEMGLRCVMWLHPNPYGPEYGPGPHFTRDETAAKLTVMEQDSGAHLPELFALSVRGLCYPGTRQVPVDPGVIGGNIAASVIMRKPDCAAAASYWQRMSTTQQQAADPEGIWRKQCGL